MPPELEPPKFIESHLLMYHGRAVAHELWTDGWRAFIDGMPFTDLGAAIRWARDNPVPGFGDAEPDDDETSTDDLHDAA